MARVLPKSDEIKLVSKMLKLPFTFISELKQEAADYMLCKDACKKTTAVLA